MGLCWGQTIDVDEIMASTKEVPAEREAVVGTVVDAEEGVVEEMVVEHDMLKDPSSRASSLVSGEISVNVDMGRNSWVS